MSNATEFGLHLKGLGLIAFGMTTAWLRTNASLSARLLKVRDALTTLDQGDRMSHYRKKPVVIEAFQYDGTIRSVDALQRWAGTEPKSDGTFRNRIEQPTQFGPLVTHTLEGDMTARKDDWIIKGVKGEFYPCKPDIFAATYEPMEEAQAGAVTSPETPARELGCPHCDGMPLTGRPLTRMYAHRDGCTWVDPGLGRKGP